MSHLGPRNLLDHMAPEQLKETEIVGDPQIPLTILGDRINHSLRHAFDRKKPVIPKVPELAGGGDPNSPATILKKGVRRKPVQFPLLFVAVGVCRILTMRASQGWWAALVIGLNFPVTPSV